MHELPHASGQFVRESVSRLHLVGSGDAMANSCIRKSNTNPTDDELVHRDANNPEAAAARGLWGDPDFLEKVAELNPKLKHTQFADYHGHGWIFRAVFKHDRKGNCSTSTTTRSRIDDPDKFAKAVHLKDVHLAHGMQCVDCHFNTDVHGNGKLYGEPRTATTIECIDCHGTITQRPTLDHHRAMAGRSICAQQQHAMGAAFRLGRQRQLYPAFNDVARRALGSAADDGHD